MQAVTIDRGQRELEPAQEIRPVLHAEARHCQHPGMPEAHGSIKARGFAQIGAPVAAGSGHAILAENGVVAEKINKVLEGRPHIEDAIRNRQVQIVFNTFDNLAGGLPLTGDWIGAGADALGGWNPTTGQVHYDRNEDYLLYGDDEQAVFHKLAAAYKEQEASPVR